MGNNRKISVKDTIFYGVKVLCRDILEMVTIAVIMFALFILIFFTVQEIHKCKGAECKWEFCPHNGFVLFGGEKSGGKSKNCQ